MSQAFSLIPRGPKTVVASNTVTAAASGNTQLLELNVLDGVEKISFQVDNTVQALDAFLVEGRVHQDASYFTIASTAGDFSAPSGRMLSANGALVSLAASASGRFDLDSSGLYSVRVSASAATDGAVITIYASGSAGGQTNANIQVTAGDTIGIDQTTPGVTNAVQGYGYTSQTSATRPNDTTAYTGGDVVGATAAAWTFANIGAAAGHIIILDADLRIDATAIPGGMTSFRLHLYNATPPSALADNAVWDLASGDRASYLGYIDLGSPADVGSTLFVTTSGINKKLLMGASTSLFGYLVTNGGFTPAAQTVKTIRLNAIGV